MLEKNTVFRKSTKGQEAFASRQSGLAPRLRSLLILVDGKRTVAELVQMASATGDVAQLLAHLEADGYIESMAGGKAGSSRTAAQMVTHQDFAATERTETDSGSDAITRPPRPAVTLPEARQLAVRRVTAILGPLGEEVCLRIEAAHTLAEYVAAVKRAYAAIRDLRGSAAAAQFGDEIEANLPPA